MRSESLYDGTQPGCTAAPLADRPVPDLDNLINANVCCMRPTQPADGGAQSHEAPVGACRRPCIGLAAFTQRLGSLAVPFCEASGVE
mmetsp:Transcript_10299/g.31631  ORF Transcript_10299/g.31631 Transcript_10299/m.31631 type:complete len:87 (-) Transcript_10299:678-938(-)